MRSPTHQVLWTMDPQRDYSLLVTAGNPVGAAYRLAIARPDAPATRTTTRAMRSFEVHDSDEELAWVRSIRTGDATAFEALFTAYYAPLLRFAFGYVKSRGVAEDLVHDMFFHLWAQRERWEVRDTVRAYLYTATRNRALNWMRHVALAERWAEGAGESGEGIAVLPRMERADERAHLAELQAAIQTAIDRLPPRCRETFVLSRQHYLSHAQIAEVMDVSVKTVQEQIARALRGMRRSLAAWLE